MLQVLFGLLWWSIIIIKQNQTIERGGNNCRNEINGKILSLQYVTYCSKRQMLRDLLCLLERLDSQFAIHHVFVYTNVCM